MAFRITPDAVEACWRGLTKKGWSQAELARRLNTDRQLVNNVLHQRSETSEILLDMLRILDEPVHLALVLSDTQKAVLERSAGLDELPQAARQRLLENFERAIAGEIALQKTGPGDK